MVRTKEYVRPETLLPVDSHYCAGCGHGILHRMVAELIEEFDIRGSTIGIAPVGCAVLAYNYIDVDMSEAAHGRVPSVATGIKRSDPNLNVIAYQGDGDLASIGTAEIIHAANRGENYTTIFVNNCIYGMTGGQMAPTTLPEQKTATCPLGRDVKDMGHPIKVCELLATLESPYLLVRTALDGPAGVNKTRRWIREALKAQIEGKGFSLIEVLSPCPTYWRMTPEQSIEHIKDVVEGYFPPGVYRHAGKPEKEAAHA